MRFTQSVNYSACPSFSTNAVSMWLYEESRDSSKTSEIYYVNRAKMRKNINIPHLYLKEKKDFNTIATCRVPANKGKSGYMNYKITFLKFR